MANLQWMGKLVFAKGAGLSSGAGLPMLALTLKSSEDDLTALMGRGFSRAKCGSSETVAFAAEGMFRTRNRLFRSLFSPRGTAPYSKQIGYETATLPVRILSGIPR